MDVLLPVVGFGEIARAATWAASGFRALTKDAAHVPRALQEV
jgi:hypothetical protein